MWKQNTARISCTPSFKLLRWVITTPGRHQVKAPSGLWPLLILKTARGALPRSISHVQKWTGGSELPAGTQALEAYIQTVLCRTETNLDNFSQSWSWSQAILQANLLIAKCCGLRNDQPRLSKAAGVRVGKEATWGYQLHTSHFMD